MSYYLRPKKGPGPWMLGVLIACAVVNIPLILGAVIDPGWGAVGIMFVFGPAANAVVGGVWLFFIPVVRATRDPGAVTPYVLTCVVAPLGWAVVDFLVISVMHGF